MHKMQALVTSMSLLSFDFGRIKSYCSNSVSSSQDHGFIYAFSNGELSYLFLIPLK